MDAGAVAVQELFLHWGSAFCRCTSLLTIEGPPTVHRRAAPNDKGTRFLLPALSLFGGREAGFPLLHVNDSNSRDRASCSGSPINHEGLAPSQNGSG
jgi:hypothetical protein